MNGFELKRKVVIGFKSVYGNYGGFYMQFLLLGYLCLYHCSLLIYYRDNFKNSYKKLLQIYVIQYLNLDFLDIVIRL